MADNLPGNTGAPAPTAPNSGGILSISEAVAAQLGDPETDTPEEQPDPEGEDNAPEPKQGGEDTPEDTPETEGVDEEPDPQPEDGETTEGEEPEDDNFVELAPENVLFKHDGLDVTLGEAEKGFLRQSDYTSKTSELAVERKAMAEERTELAREREHYSQSLDAMQATLDAASDPQIDWDTLRTTDPVAYLQQKEAQRERQDQQVKIKDEQTRLAAQAQQEHTAARTRHEQEQGDQLLVALPSWGDEKVAGKEKSEIVSYLGEMGFTPEETQNVTDHRLVLMLRDAVAGKALRKGKAPNAKKLAKTRPMMRKAGTGSRGAKSENARMVQADKRLSKSGSMEDAMDLQMERLK